MHTTKIASPLSGSSTITKQIKQMKIGRASRSISGHYADSFAGTRTTQYTAAAHSSAFGKRAKTRSRSLTGMRRTRKKYCRTFWSVREPRQRIVARNDAMNAVNAEKGPARTPFSTTTHSGKSDARPSHVHREYSEGAGCN